MGLFGNSLLEFCAQFKPLKYFDMLPLFNSGYDKTKNRQGMATTSITIYGAVHNLTPSQIKMSEGLLSATNNMTLWTQDELRLGNFIEDDKGIIFRIKSENIWESEAGYKSYILEKVVGDNDKNLITVTMDKGNGEFI